jgi:hypothetical protein
MMHRDIERTSLHRNRTRPCHRTGWRHCMAASALLIGVLCLSSLAQTPPSAPGSAGGMGDALSIREIRMGYGVQDGGPATVTVLPGEPVPTANATFLYRGAGVVSGRWEVVLPGEPQPGNGHAVPDFAVSASDRLGLTRYRVIDTFQESLAPGGRHVLVGPDPAKLPRDLPGRYTVLLRITAISAVTGSNPAQPGLTLPRIEYIALGVRPPASSRP